MKEEVRVQLSNVMSSGAMNRLLWKRCQNLYLLSRQILAFLVPWHWSAVRVTEISTPSGESQSVVSILHLFQGKGWLLELSSSLSLTGMGIVPLPFPVSSHISLIPDLTWNLPDLILLGGTLNQQHCLRDPTDSQTSYFENVLNLIFSLCVCIYTHMDVCFILW